MTKTQIWTSAFLAIFILLFFLQRATMKEDTVVMNEPEENYEPAQTQQASGSTGAELVQSFGCYSCHGSDLKGTNLAPGLIGLADYYDRDKLINYLRNPNSFMDQDRFVEYKQKYPNIVMPAYNNKDVKDLGKIADYLLELK